MSEQLQEIVYINLHKEYLHEMGLIESTLFCHVSLLNDVCSFFVLLCLFKCFLLRELLVTSNDCERAITIVLGEFCVRDVDW